jgi:hypothetical protein
MKTKRILSSGLVPASQVQVLKIKFGKHRDSSGKYITASKWMQRYWNTAGNIIYISHETT